MQLCRRALLNATILILDACKPSPCGDSALCSLAHGAAICSCPEGMTGNPLERCCKWSYKNKQKTIKLYIVITPRPCWCLRPRVLRPQHAVRWERRLPGMPVLRWLCPALQNERRLHAAQASRKARAVLTRPLRPQRQLHRSFPSGRVYLQKWIPR